jgi:hypothetical protein
MVLRLSFLRCVKESNNNALKKLFAVQGGRLLAAKFDWRRLPTIITSTAKYQFWL